MVKVRLALSFIRAETSKALILRDEVCLAAISVLALLDDDFAWFTLFPCWLFRLISRVLSLLFSATICSHFSTKLKIIAQFFVLVELINTQSCKAKVQTQRPR